MSKHSGGELFLLLAGVLIFGIFIGVTWTASEVDHQNVWPEDREGLKLMNHIMKKDKSERLGMAVITRANVYQITAVDGFHVSAEMVRD